MSDLLAGKTVAELKAMMANAEAVLARPDVKKHPAAAAFRDAAKAALAGRRVTGNARAPDEALAAATARIKQVAAEALARFDLSPETASKLGVKAPHRTLAANGEPKTGGGVKTRKFRKCPYISYSGPGGRIAMLQYAVPPDDAEPFWSGGVVALGSVESKTNLVTAMAEEAAVDAFLHGLTELAPARS